MSNEPSEAFGNRLETVRILVLAIATAGDGTCEVILSERLLALQIVRGGSRTFKRRWGVPTSAEALAF